MNYKLIAIAAAAVLVASMLESKVGIGSTIGGAIASALPSAA